MICSIGKEQTIKVLLYSQFSLDLIKKKFTNFINQQKTIISQNTQNILKRNQYINLMEAFQQDIYCLGFSIMLMMNEKQQINKFQNHHFFLQKCLLNYSEKLITIVKSMIQEIPSKRITLEKLRMKLKSQQEQIMRQEMIEFKKQKILKTQRSQRLTTQKSSPQSKVSPISLQQHFTATKPKNNTITIQTTSLNTPLQNQTSNRKNFIYYSPPTKRIQMKSPNFQRENKSTHTFTYHSPRKF